MEIQFWGAAQTVTGSMHLVKVNGYKLLLDCGLYQGRRKEAFELNRSLPFDASEIDALVLSHAHIDHSGNIPNLVKNGFRGPIWATPATADLLNYMLRDSAYIQEQDVRYVNKRRRRQGKVLFEPLYKLADVEQALSQIQLVRYHQKFSPIPGSGIRTLFIEAGHMLGSATVILDINDQGVHKRLAFSGDIGRKNLPILRDPEYVRDADVVIMESTYGDRFHAPIENSSRDLKAQILAAYHRRGKIIIPSFAVGRTQELVYALHKLYEEGEIPLIDVYVDSPLAVDVTQVFKDHPEVYDAEVNNFLHEIKSTNVFGFNELKYIRDVEQSKKLNSLNRPAIIISASGMCEAGRILHHLKNNITNERNMVLFVGYQGQHTLGRKILDGRSPVPIFGDDYEVKAEVHKLEGYSGHADRNGLLRWLKKTVDTKMPQHVFLVHGELEGAQSLAEGIRDTGVKTVSIPARGDTFEL